MLSSWITTQIYVRSNQLRYVVRSSLSSYYLQCWLTNIHKYITSSARVPNSRYYILADYMQIPYSGKLSREKAFMNPWNISFRGENFRGFATDRMLCAINQSGPHPFSWRKLSRTAVHPQNSWKFSPSKVSRYMVLPQYMYICQEKPLY